MGVHPRRRARGGASKDSSHTIPARGDGALTRADAITFMMLMNSTSSRFLIEEQVAGAPFIAKAGVEPIPMGYLICAPGGKAGEVGQAKLIQKSETDRVAHLRNGGPGIWIQDVLLGGW